MTDEQRSRSVGILHEVPVSFEHLHFTMDFWVMEISPFCGETGVLALEVLQKCLDYGLQQVSLPFGSKKATLLFEYAVVEMCVDDSLETDNEDFIFDSDAASDIDKDYGEHFVAAPDVDPAPSSSSYSASTFSR